MAANEDQERNEQPQPQPRGGPAGGGGFALSGKTLGLAGGGAAALVVIVVVVLLATGVFGGGGGGGGASGGSDILAYVPADAAGVGIFDHRAVLNGDVPEDLIESWEDDESSGGFGDFPDSYDDLDIDDDDIATFAFVADEDLNDSLLIVQGDFEFDFIREDLEDGADCEDDEYRGFELWECPDGGAVALFEKDGYLVFAISRQDDLEDLLTLKSRTPEKLADGEDSDLRRILDQAGNGWLRFAFITDDCVINRCEGIAIAVQESDDGGSIPASYALKFSSERAATAAEGDVAIDDFVEEMFAGFDLDLDIGNVKADGEFVVGDGIAEFVEPGDPRSSNVNGGGNGGAGRTQPAATEAARVTAAPAATAPPPSARLQQGAVSRDDWVEDCSGVQMEVEMEFQKRLPRHQQVTYTPADLYQLCECRYDYFVEWDGPPTATWSDLRAGRLGLEGMHFLDLIGDSTSYCSGR